MTRTLRRGLTILELLVVLSVIALLVAALLPAVTSSRESSRTSGCQSTLHQIGVGITNYAQANNGFLPAYANSTPPYDNRWSETLAYDTGLASGASIGKTHLICPTFTPYRSGGVTNALSYGVNFPGVFAWAEVPPTANPPASLSGGAKLIKVPAEVFLVADTFNPVDEPSSGIFHPAAYPFTNDVDGDGVIDTNFSLFAYNGLDPRHGARSANFVFADAAVRTVALADWLNNANGMWGAEDVSYK